MKAVLEAIPVGVKILGKTVEAVQLLRQSQSPLDKDARTLLMLIDGKCHIKHLQVLAAANGVQSFEESLAHLDQAGLIQELPETDEDALELDTNAADYPDTYCITLDFAVPPGVRDERPRAVAPDVRATIASQQPAPNGAAGRKLPTPQDQELYAKLMEELKPKVEAELRAMLLPEVRATIQKELTAKLIAVLRPRIEKHYRERMEAALAARLQAAPLPCKPDPVTPLDDGLALTPADASRLI